MNKNQANRRDFIKASAAITSASLLASSCISENRPSAETNYPQGKPSEELRFAQVGCGGKGSSDLSNTIDAGGKLVAMCDVDKGRASGHFKKYKDVPVYDDYRVMLEKHDKDIDAVVVSTPDHTHACIALEAIKRGKHVYVQKPLARTYQECQVLLDAAERHKVVTQMGNQGHAGDGLKMWEKFIEEDAFGEILEVHSWSNRPIWPQGMTSLPKGEEAPKGLSWNKWIGPVEERPFSKAYVPFKWRGWWDFGCGAIGDMAVHNMDPAFWVLKLGHPSKIVAQASAPATVAYPQWSIIDLYFDKSPVTGKPVKITWYDGKKLPKMPAGTHPERSPGGNGCMIVGSKMSALGGAHASMPRVISLTGKEYGPELKEVEKHWRDEGKKLKGDNHHKQWVDAAKKCDFEASKSRFEYSAPFTQTLLLACIALRYPGKELHFDTKTKKFTNHDEANSFLQITPRKGYDLTL